MGMIIKHPQLPFQLELLYHAPQTVEPALYHLNAISKGADVTLDDGTLLKCNQVVFIRRDDILDHPKPECFMALTEEGELVDLKDKCDISDVWRDKIQLNNKGLFSPTCGYPIVINQVAADNPLYYLTITVAVVTPTVKDTFKPFFVWMRRFEGDHPFSAMDRFRWMVKMNMLNVFYQDTTELIKNYACYLGITSEEKLISYLMTILTNAYRSTNRFNSQWFMGDDPPF